MCAMLSPILAGSKYYQLPHGESMRLLRRQHAFAVGGVRLPSPWATRESMAHSGVCSNHRVWRKFVMMRSALVWVFGISVLAAPRSMAESKTEGQIAQALERGLPIVQKAAANYPMHRDCFSCHHQTLPMLAMVSIRGRGPSIDEKLLKSQAEFSHATFQRHIKQVKKGQGIGGPALTGAYGPLAPCPVGWQ